MSILSTHKSQGHRGEALITQNTKAHRRVSAVPGILPPTNLLVEPDGNGQVRRADQQGPDMSAMLDDVWNGAEKALTNTFSF